MFYDYKLFFSTKDVIGDQGDQKGNVWCFWKEYVRTFFLLGKFSGPFYSKQWILKIISVEVQQVQLFTEYGHDTFLIETSSLFLNNESI